MNAPIRHTPGLQNVLDILLADIAIRVQLSQTAYNQAVKRYEAISEWIERDGSPLAGRVELFYPQGSMAIGSTIASRVTNDEYDLDVVVQIRVPSTWSAEDVLEALFIAIRGDVGSQYYRMVQKRPRCVTVSYADMHLDLIPMERRPGTPERESDLFHHEEGSNPSSGRCVVNSFGFAEWFKERTADAGAFGLAFAERARAYHFALAKADTDPVPEQEAASAKSLPVIGLQLMKRWRNVCYQDRTTRRPPSVMMTKFAAERAGETDNLAEELVRQATHMRDHFHQAEMNGSLIHVVSPACDQDVLSDRWPASHSDQRQFLADLEGFIRAMQRLRSDHDLDELRQQLAVLFGEWPARKAIEAFSKQAGENIRKGRNHLQRVTGAIALPGTVGVTSPKHRFYGGGFPPP